MSEAQAKLRSTRAALEQRLATMDRLLVEASQRVYRGESTDRTAVASVDGNGRLLALQVDPAAFRVAHPERVGPAIVAAVTTARELAAAEKAERVREMLGHREDP